VEPEKPDSAPFIEKRFGFIARSRRKFPIFPVELQASARLFDHTRPCGR
jgi:hypothetical protein